MIHTGFAQMLLLFHLNVTGVSSKVVEYVFLQYLEGANPIIEDDNILDCLWLS